MLLVAFRVVSSWQIVGPAITDEMGYLGTARYLAGEGDLVAPEARSAYKLGYSVLLTPAFWLATSLESAYRWVMGINALLLASVFLSVRAILGVVFSGLSPVQRSAIAVVGSLTPGTIIYGATAFSSGAYVACLFAYLVALAYAFRDDRSWMWLVAGAAASYCYLVHESAAGVMLLALLLTAALPVWRRVVDRRWSFSSWAGVVGVVTVAFVERNVDIPGTRYSTGDKGGGLVSGALDDWQGMLATASGHWWYLSLASFGIVALGAAVALVAPSRRCVSRISPLWWLTVVASTASIFAIVAIGARDGATRHLDLTFLIYGRHLEIVTAVLVPLGLAALVRLAPTLDWKRYAVAVGLGLMPLLAVALALRISRPEFFAQIPYYLNDTALWVPYSLGWGGLAKVTAFAALLTLFVAAVIRWHWVGALLGVGFLALNMGQATVDDFIKDFYDDRIEQRELVALVKELVPEGTRVAYDEESSGNLHYVSLDYWLIERDFVRGDVTTTEAPLLVSTDPDLDERVDGARAVAFESIPPEFGSYFVGLWVPPGPLQDELDGAGWLLPQDDPVYGEPTSIDARYDADLSGDGVSLEVLNTGGSPWNSFAAVKRGPRSIVLRTWWLDPQTGETLQERRFGLPESVHPGTSATVEVAMPADAADRDLQLWVELRFAEEPVGPEPFAVASVS